MVPAEWGRVTAESIRTCGTPNLLATVLRSPYSQQGASSLLLQPLYVGISLLIAAVTVLVGFNDRQGEDDWLLLSVLFFAFLVYPATLEHYGVFLIIPVLLLLRMASQGVREQIIALLVILIVYFLSGYKSGYYTFYANALVWLVCIAFELRLNLPKVFRRNLNPPILK